MSDGREKNPDAATAATPAEVAPAPAPVTPGRRPLRVHLQQIRLRLKIGFTLLYRWWVNQAASPEEIGKAPKKRFHRPAAIEIGFFLHADGRVFIRDRNGGGDIRCEIQEVKDLVRREYALLMDQHRRRFQRRGKVLRRFREFTSKRKDVDTAKARGVT